MTKTVKISGVTFELRDFDKETNIDSKFMLTKKFPSKIAFVDESEVPGVEAGTKLFVPYRYTDALKEYIDFERKIATAGFTKTEAKEFFLKIKESTKRYFSIFDINRIARVFVSSGVHVRFWIWGSECEFVGGKYFENGVEIGNYETKNRNYIESLKCFAEYFGCECHFVDDAPVPGTPGVEDTSMELSDDVLDEIIKSGTPAPATLIYDAGNAEEAINALTANYEPQELKEFMQSFMRVLETMKNAGEDISIYKNAVKLLGHDLHVAPFKFWVTDWYFDDRNYALIVKALKAGEKYEMEEV